MNALVSQIVGGFIRNGVAALAGYMAAGGIAITGGQTDTLTSAAMILAALAWTAGQKWWAKRAARTGAVAAAVASAEAGQAVTVTVTPVGEPNIATRVPVEEQRAAPQVTPAIPQP